MEAEVVKLNGGNAAGLNANICVCLYLSPCELGMNDTGGDGYYPRDFVCLSEEPRNRAVRARLTGWMLWARLGRVSRMQRLWDQAT
jgi:hypothetical protein